MIAVLMSKLFSGMTLTMHKFSFAQCAVLQPHLTKLMMSNEWFLNGNPVDEPPDGAVGFIYRITRLDTGRQYLGKKLLQFRRTKQVKGVKKKMMVESDWKTYYGSNQTLKEEVAAIGADKFRREIIKFCF